MVYFVLCNMESHDMRERCLKGSSCVACSGVALRARMQSVLVLAITQDHPLLVEGMHGEIKINVILLYYK